MSFLSGSSHMFRQKKFLNAACRVGTSELLRRAGGR
jgi:hypothetical protein